ncbi:MAG: restriction endonuclease subunit S [Faecalibacterium prausnitzii]|nr:restriction endonuclease subunit S [Faecalibacterium prausnitzii]
MSKLDELLRELCPNGVEYKKLGEIATVLRGASPRPIKKYITNDSDGVNWIKIGDVPVGSKYITQSEEKITKEGAEKSRYVRKGDFILSNSMSFGRPYILAIDGCIHDGWLSISNFKDVFLSDYLYYLLSSSAIQQEMKKRASFGGAVQNLNADIVKALVLPVPPIEVQSEIVRILDDYTENVVELQNQLALEITARQRQYTFYRNKLLTFSGNEKAKIVKISLGDIGPICMCKRILKSQTNTVEGVPFYKIGTFGKKADAYISKETFDEYRSKYSFPKKGDVLISAAGTIGRTVVYDGKPAYFQDSNIVWIDNNESVALNSYLHYCYELKPWKVSSGGTIQRLYNDNIAKAIITVPSLDVQNRIVNVLDNFEKICSDLNIGLPAEIEARQKQYEYYRSRAEQSRAEQSRAEQSRAEQSRALIKLVQYVYGCVWLELGDVIVSLNTGLNPRKFFKLNTEDATNYYITIREMKDGKIVPSEKTDRMNDEARKLCNNRSNLEVGDVLFSGTGTIGETAVIEKEPSNWNIKEGVYAIKPNQTMIQPMYLRYILITDFIKKEYMKKAAGGTVQSVPMGELKKIRIPVPSLQEQSRIVEVLKKLDDLCNGLTNGLPAEIEARQKQYEYYRDKLLSFKERL